MAINPSVYLAGPDVFQPDAVALGRQRVELCALYGFVGLNPADNDLLPGTVPTAAGIYQNCIGLMRRAEVGIFNLSPFHGPGADGGTAFELGFMVANGLPVFGYTTDQRDYRNRVIGGRFEPVGGCWSMRPGR